MQCLQAQREADQFWIWLEVEQIDFTKEFALEVDGFHIAMVTRRDGV
jgi:hypothetical protein